MKIRILLVCLSALLVISCGGGGSSSPSTTNPTPTPTPTPPVLVKGANLGIAPVDFGAFAISSTDSLLQLSFLVKNLVDQDKATVAGKELSCINGGLAKTEYTNNDTSELLKDDIITVTFRDCERPEMGDVVSGTLPISVSASDQQSGAYTVEAVFSNFKVGSQDYLSIDGNINVTIVKSQYQNSLTLLINEPFQISATDGFALGLNNITLERSSDLITAKYHLNIQGDIIETPYQGEFSITTNSDFVGHFGEFPHEGQITLSSNASSSIVIDANFVSNSNKFDLSYNNIVQQVWWFDIVEGAIWSFDGRLIQNGIEYRLDNFAHIQTSVSNPTNFPLLGSMDAVFSRSVATLADQNFVFSSYDWNYSDVPAKVSINGAVVSVTPTTPLEAGVEYYLFSLEASSAQGQTAYAYFPNIVASTDAIATITSDQYFYSINEAPLLSVDYVFENGDSAASYNWIDANDSGVLFSSQNAATTNMNLSELAEGTTLVTVLAEVVSTQGLVAYAATTLNIVPDTKYVFAYTSEKGDYIGGGQSKVYTDADGVFSTSTSESLDYISFSFQGATWWSLDIAAPNDQPLALGKYEDATRWPFQSPTGPGLNQSGNGRGCNNSFGEFEIFELEMDGSDVKSLAVDWSQHCESEQAPVLRGILRYNSTYPL